MSLIVPDRRLIVPTEDGYTLPVVLLDPNMLRPDDEEMLGAMLEFTPRSKFKTGDLAMLQEVPDYVKWQCAKVPRIWKVRFVVSRWAHELMGLIHSYDDIRGIDHAVALMEERDPTAGIYTGRRGPYYEAPIVYAHGYPHGMYPDTAHWFAERVLKKIVLNETNAEWPEIVEEAQAPFLGYDSCNLLAPFLFDVAPDKYSAGCDLNRPFRHEETVTHTAALLGLEEMMWVPMSRKTKAIPRDHDIWDDDNQS